MINEKLEHEPCPFNCIYLLLQIDQPPTATKTTQPPEPVQVKKTQKLIRKDTRKPSTNITGALLKEILAKEPDRIKVFLLEPCPTNLLLVHYRRKSQAKMCQYGRALYAGQPPDGFFQMHSM